LFFSSLTLLLGSQPPVSPCKKEEGDDCGGGHGGDGGNDSDDDEDGKVMGEDGVEVRKVYENMKGSKQEIKVIVITKS
jgi:hypothetical protein